MQICEMAGQMSLFGQDGCVGKMCRAFSAQGSPRVRTSVLSSRKSAELAAVPFLSLDLTPGHGNLLGESYWELLSPSLGGSSMLNTGVSPREGRGCSLPQILEDSPHRKYYLSRKACLGILRRAHERGKGLPPQLEAALMAQAGLAPIADTLEYAVFAANQRDEVRDLHDAAGAPASQAGMKQQTFIAAAFSAGAGKTAGGIGYSENIAPTLKGSASGNCMPSVLCLNDQGGGIMDCSEDMTGTLRSQTHGHQPVVFENHGIAARYKGPLPVTPTLSARAGTGGNNLSLVSQPMDSDTKLLYSRQRVDIFKDGEIASTQSARQHKDATDLVCQPAYQEAVIPLLIRRLTPLECERLMGLPSGWTNMLGAADSARYRALGNSVAIPCVEYIMRGIVMAACCQGEARSPAHGRSPLPPPEETSR